MKKLSIIFRGKTALTCFLVIVLVKMSIAQTRPFVGNSTQIITPHYAKSCVISSGQSSSESSSLKASISFSPIKNLGIAATGGVSDRNLAAGFAFGYYQSNRLSGDSIAFSEGAQIDIYGGVQYSKFFLDNLDFRFTEYYIMLGLHKKVKVIGFSFTPRLILADVTSIEFFNLERYRYFYDETEKHDPFLYGEMNLSIRFEKDHFGAYLQFSKLFSKRSALIDNGLVFTVGGYIDIARYIRVNQ